MPSCCVLVSTESRSVRAAGAEHTLAIDGHHTAWCGHRHRHVGGELRDLGQVDVGHESRSKRDANCRSGRAAETKVETERVLSSNGADMGTDRRQADAMRLGEAQEELADHRGIPDRARGNTVMSGDGDIDKRPIPVPA